ncbi:MAG: hypothetical protein WCC94_08430 [Candidatus Bathyarchaeia archaeon]
MDEEGFREFCTKRKLDEKTIRAHIGVVREFEVFLNNKDRNRNLSSATADDLQSYVGQLMENDMNTWENLLGLLRYGRFAGNRQVEIALLELLDGSDVFENLSETMKQKLGEDKRNEILEGITLPALGTHSKDKPKVTKEFMERMETKLGEEKSKEILLSGPHAGPKEEYLPERKTFLASKNIDDFLKKRHREYVDSLEKHMKEKTLYFTQEIDEEVLDYVRNTPTCQNGVRDGDTIYVTKIPYMAKKYLHEKDEKKRRYYYCHCPWVREAILSDLKVSPNFCYCSAAFEKRPWDVIFDQPVRADVVETVLKGDLICKFAIHIPRDFLESKGTTPKK